MPNKTDHSSAVEEIESRGVGEAKMLLSRMKERLLGSENKSRSASKNHGKVKREA